MSGFDDDTRLIIDQLNARASTLGPELLPNGRRSGNKWMFSGIADHGKSESAYLHLSGPKQGLWLDLGNAAAGEERGDMLDLLRLKRCGGDKAAAFAEARRELGLPERGSGKRISDADRQAMQEASRKRAEARDLAFDRQRAKKAKNAKRLFLRGYELIGTPGEQYFLGRDLSPEPVGSWPGSLRYFGETHHGPLGAKLPAVLACIVTAEGQHIGTHRIFLQKTRGKGWGKLMGAPDATSKMVLGNMWGGFVPIHKGRSGASMANMAEGEPIYVTEGIEDALAVRMVKPEARIIAAITLANIGGIVLPRAARKLVVVADRDEKPAAQDALEQAIAKQQARGLDVSLVMPPPGIKDMNDWLRAQGRDKVA
jgi:hypothetical protein